MASLNHCQFIGNLGTDPELKYLPSGDAVANFSIACTEKWKDKNGDKQESTEWVRLVAFGKRAELAGEYLKKGSPVYVQCRMRTRKWQDKEGNDRYSTEFVIDQMQFLGGRGGGDNGDARAQQQASAYQRESGSSSSARAPAGGGGGHGGGFDDFSDDIPFITCAHDVLGAKLQRRMRKIA